MSFVRCQGFSKGVILFIIAALLAPAPSYAIDTIAKQAYLVDMNTGAVLLNKNGDQQMHPSSMSKLMTVYILFKRLHDGKTKLDDKFLVSEKAWRTQGSKMFVGLGDSIAIEDLIKGIVVQSGNDACIVVAEGLDGTEDAFVAEMNQTAKALGLTQSHFVNPTGLPDPNHLMSAHDLATLAEAIIAGFPEYYHYFSIPSFTYDRITQGNRNRLLGNDIGIDGLKTGHTDEGGYGILLSAKQGNRRLVLVINGLDSDNDRLEEGNKLMHWGFRAFEDKAILHNGQKVAEAPVWFGDVRQVPLVAASDVMMTLPAGGANVSMTLKYLSPIPAPIAKGAHIADLVVKADNVEETIPLVAGEDVGKLSGFGRLWPAFKHFVLHRG